MAFINFPKQREATDKEVGVLKSVIKCIEDYNLESKYPKEILVKRIEELEMEQTNRKCPAAVPTPQPWQQSKPQKCSGSKHSRTTSPATMPQSVAGLLPDCHAPYLSSRDGPDGLAGTTPAMAFHAGSSAGPYGFSGAPLDFIPGSLTPIESNLASESHMQSGYYDRPIVYNGHGLPPQYNLSYYPE
ncbi:unnamed protein product [Ilex paraguariensis]|uniref:FRIGIDA-like protein n=1 Tax=Ilex paraguariensis TaxID=185542 RepID=A0ABC8RWE9_9AQUA